MKSGLLQGHIARSEAIADTGANDDQIDINVRADGQESADIGVRIGFKPKLLEVEVQEPVAAQLVIETSLNGGAPIVVELEARMARPRALIEEEGVIHACTDVRLEGGSRIEVVLERKRRRKEPDISDLAETPNSAGPIDRVRRDAQDEFRGNILREEVGQIEFGDGAIRDRNVRI